jgi:rfaE bifunctional protein kinase chain/domain
VVGDDDNGQRVRRLLDASGIQTHLGSDPQLQTTVKLRIIGRQQQLLRADFESEPRSEVLASQTRQFHTLLPQHQAVLFSDYGKGGLTHIADMIAAARAAKLPVLIDPKGSDYSRYAQATVITPNRAELLQVVGRWHDEAHLLQLAQALRQDLKLDALLLTRSEEGMSLFDAQGVLHVPAVAREVFDVTGAGDTVIATLAALMGAGMSMREALPWANKAGGIVVGKFGTASVTFQELSA